MSKIGDKIKGLKNKAKRRARQAAIVGAATFAVAGGTACSNNGENKSESPKGYIEYKNDEGSNLDYSTWPDSAKFKSKRVEEGDSIDGHPVLKPGKEGKPDSVLVETKSEGTKKSVKYMPVDAGDELQYGKSTLIQTDAKFGWKKGRVIADTTYTYDEDGKHMHVNKKEEGGKWEEVTPKTSVRKLSYKVKPKERD